MKTKRKIKTNLTPVSILAELKSSCVTSVAMGCVLPTILHATLGNPKGQIWSFFLFVWLLSIAATQNCRFNFKRSEENCSLVVQG